METQTYREYLGAFRDADDMRIVVCPGCDDGKGNGHIAVMVDDLETFDIDCDCGTVVARDTYKGPILTVPDAITSLS